MDKFGFVEIKITGSKGNLDLSPENFDIREVISILQIAENLLYTEDKKNRPIISYEIQKGSVKHILKTTIQYIIGFNAVIGHITETQNIDFLDLQTAKAFEHIQNLALKRNYVFNIKTSLKNTNEIIIDTTTQFYRTEVVWAEAEFYFYGKVTYAGGKNKANIYVFTEEFGKVKIETPIGFLEQYNENLLYRTLGVRATGKQHSVTGEVDMSSLKFIELVEYKPQYDEQYLKTLRDKAKKSWLNNINPDEWLKEIREGYDA